MIAQRIILTLGVIILTISCLTVLRSIFSRRAYEIDFRPDRFKPEAMRSHTSKLQLGQTNASNRRR